MEYYILDPKNPDELDSLKLGMFVYIYSYGLDQNVDYDDCTTKNTSTRLSSKVKLSSHFVKTYNHGCQKNNNFAEKQCGYADIRKRTDAQFNKITNASDGLIAQGYIQYISRRYIKLAYKDGIVYWFKCKFVKLPVSTRIIIPKTLTNIKILQKTEKMDIRLILTEAVKELTE